MSSNWNETFEDKTDPSKTYRMRPNSDFSGANLSRYDLTGASLSFSNFQGADLRGTNFTLATMWNCDFRGADLRGTNFSKANLQRCNFTGAIFGDTYAYGAQFDDCNFRGQEFGFNCDFTAARFHRATFDQCVFVQPDPEIAGQTIDTVKFENADLSWAYLRRCDLFDFRLGWAKLRNTDFSHSDLHAKDMSAWDMDGARFNNCNLQGILIDGAVFEFLTMDYADLTDANFINSTIHSRVEFNGATCIRTSFQGTYFNINSEFDGANLNFTNWDDADISGVWARSADFTGSSFVNTVMVGGYFQGSNFADCVFDAANWKEASFKTANFQGAIASNANTPELNANDTKWNSTYLAGARFSNIDICGAYTWELATFEDLITDEEGNESMLRFFGSNIVGPDCYLYHAHREIADPSIPVSDGYPSWPFPEEESEE